MDKKTVQEKQARIKSDLLELLCRGDFELSPDFFSSVNIDQIWMKFENSSINRKNPLTKRVMELVRESFANEEYSGECQYCHQHSECLTDQYNDGVDLCPECASKLYRGELILKEDGTICEDENYFENIRPQIYRD